MPKKWTGDDSRGAKAKEQRAAAQAAKDAELRKKREEAEAASWKEGSDERRARRCVPRVPRTLGPHVRRSNA